ncbi:monocarboxylate transporter 12-B-like isoform X2 [Mya arenaria]|uniref:monocarboxylate transporter 12-B-like isoform X2 n=1 Tax=Mya arenaria TaxID=6604 RepID=UPI0022E817CA|nr:monocarboxylate transporter 12-B-like isoform X2 [Mya arenaria]
MDSNPNDGKEGEKGNIDTEIDIEENTIDAPDGGWGWLVVLGSFIIHAIQGGLERSNGILYLQMRHHFGQSATDTAWVLSLYSLICRFVGPISSGLCTRYSFRVVTFLGVSLTVAGMLSSGFVPTVQYLYLTYGLVVGVGCSLSYTACILVVGHYFNTRRGIAIGVAASGVGFGCFAWPPVLRALFEYFGFRGAFLIIGAIVSHVYICGMLFMPLIRRKVRIQLHKITPDKDKNETTVTLLSQEIKSKQLNEAISKHCENSSENSKMLSSDSKTAKTEHIPKRRFIDLTLFRNYAFTTMCGQMVLFALSYNLTFVYLPALAKDQGISELEGSYLISITGVFDMIARISMSALLDTKHVKPYRLIAYNLTLFVTAALTVAMPSLHSFFHFAFTCALFGFVSGTYISQLALIMVDILGISNLASAFGLNQLFQGIGMLLGPVIGGLIRDFLGNYYLSFYCGSASTFAAGLLLMTGNIWLRRRGKAL